MLAQSPKEDKEAHNNIEQSLEEGHKFGECPE
jgi:hypothetical protein